MLHPAEVQSDLGRRLTSSNDREFRGAFLELYCHQLLLFGAGIE